VPVRVLGDNGAGTFANILAGLAWVRNNAHKPAVAVLGFGGPRDDGSTRR